MKVISFCLYGTKQLYKTGAIKNAELCKSIYPDWSPWFYLSPSIEKSIAKELKDLGATVMYVDDVDSAFFMNYRYFPSADLRVTHAIFRDTDSRVDAREAAAVDEWVKSGKSLHVMRDHPWHGPSQYAMMLGGMWGARAEKLRNIKDLIFKYPKQDRWGTDQVIITQQIYPLFTNDMVVHDEFFEKKPYPMKRDGYKFVGCQYDENDKPVNPEHLELLKQHIEHAK